MFVVIIAMVVVAALLAAIVVSTMMGVRGGGRAASRTLSQQAIADGVDLYRLALDTGVANESTAWIVPPADLQRMLGSRGQVIPIEQLAGLPAELRTPVAGAPRQVVRMRSSDGSYRFWQFLRVVGPGAGATNGRVTVWIRGWYGGADGTTGRPTSVARAELAPGTFHQFQLLVDGPIRFDGGAVITGPVHSNGRAVGSGAAIAPLPGASVSCQGEFARLTSADGSIDGMPGSCRRPSSRQTWSFGSVPETFARIRAAALAGGRGVFYARPAGTGRVPVRLLGSTVDVGGAAVPIGEGLVVLVDGDASVSGSTSGRVTVASDPDRADAGSILVDGDVVAQGPTAAIGLYTEGDVIVSTRPCISRIDAAVIAARGALTIDRAFRTDLAQLDAPRCGAFELHGSIAAAESPVLRWTWPAGIATGYETRRYTWNPRLVNVPPPWTPVLEGWQVRDQREASVACGQGGRADACT